MMTENDILKPLELVDDQYQLECSIPYRRELLPLLEKETAIGVLNRHRR